MSVDLRDDAAMFVDKWRARWPEWAVAMVFVPKDQQPLAEAWFTLLQELTDAAWGGGDPTPGLAKLAWWQEELGGWTKGARRHPLGGVLQPQPAPWLQLGRALPDLRALRDAGTGGDPAGAGEDPGDGSHAGGGKAFATAVADCEAALFGGRGPDAEAVSAVHASLLGERALLRAATLDPTAPSHATAGTGHPASRPRGVQQALVSARLRRPGAPLPPLRALFTAWRGARSAA